MSKKDSGEDGHRINKSKAIRELIAAQPAVDSKSVVSQLGEQGIKVSPTMVYYVKSKLKHAKNKAKRERAAESSRDIGAINPVQLVVRVKGLAREVGGMKHLKQLVDILAE